MDSKIFKGVGEGRERAGLLGRLRGIGKREAIRRQKACLSLSSVPITLYMGDAKVHVSPRLLDPSEELIVLLPVSRRSLLAPPCPPRLAAPFDGEDPTPPASPLEVSPYELSLHHAHPPAQISRAAPRSCARLQRATKRREDAAARSESRFEVP